AEQERGQDHHQGNGQHQHQRGEPAPPAEQGNQPIGQRVEGEGEDRRPHQRREEGRDEEVELVEQEQEDGEEERREELLPRHASTARRRPWSTSPGRSWSTAVWRRSPPSRARAWRSSATPRRT